jgi:hypothetical protein
MLLCAFADEGNHNRPQDAIIRKIRDVIVLQKLITVLEIFPFEMIKPSLLSQPAGALSS